jgi:hypothetical protein
MQITMFVLRKLDRYIIESYYHNDSNRLMYTINTIISPDLIYECYGEYQFGKLLIQGNYIITLTNPNGYLLDIIYLKKKLTNIRYSRYLVKNLIYIKIYNIDRNLWRLIHYDLGYTRTIYQKIWNEIKQSFKYIKL